MTLTLHLSRRNLTSLNGIELDTNLQKLYLLYNEIKDIRALSSLTNLKELYLGSNRIKDIGELSSLTNLHLLHLCNNEIKEIGALSSLTNLQQLYLISNQIKDIGGLSNLSNLHTLTLWNNQISDWEEKRDKLIQRNSEIAWKVVKPQFIRYCFTLAPLNLPVDILIMIFDVNSYPNHLYQKWEIGKTIKNAYQKIYQKIEFKN
jgi:Leucine-rich repeat (LRR) protein